VSIEGIDRSVRWHAALSASTGGEGLRPQQENGMAARFFPI
jgi:hypothetical protein